MEKLLKVGIIGCGGIANGKHMPGLKNTGLCEMVAFCDIVVDRAHEAKRAYGTADAAVYEDYKELLKDPTIDVVHVCTPNRSHSFISVDALEAGKHVMCEKPMAINSAEAKKMLETAKKTGKKLTIGYQGRQADMSIYLHESCENGEFGDIYFAKATALRRRGVPTWGVFLNEYEQGGGPLIDIGTHALDLTLWCMNNYKPKYCVGTTFHKLNNDTETANAFGDWEPEKFTVEDSAFGFVVMENGATIILESSWALNMRICPEAVTTICGTKGGADMVDGLHYNGVKKGRMYDNKIDMTTGGVAYYAGKSVSPDTREAYQWLTAIIEDKNPTVLPEQAYIVSCILEGIYESAKTGKPFYFNV